jgi:hypothetical protein
MPLPKSLFKVTLPHRRKTTHPAPTKPAIPGAPHWRVRVELTEDARADVEWTARLKEVVAAQLRKKLESTPTRTRFTFRIPPLYAVTVELVGDAGDNEARAALPLRLLRPRKDALTPSGPLPTPAPPMPTHSTRLIGGSTPSVATPEGALTLPESEVHALGRRLVGLEEIQREVLWYLGCYYDNELESWAAQAKQELPAAMRATFEASVPLFLFSGDPGTGKSALSRVIADSYCRQQDISGMVLTVGTETRGNGLVGSFSREVRGAFERLLALPGEGLRALVIEEADAIVMRRSEGASQQEDRAATSTILQCLDALPSQSQGRFLIVLTTNRTDAIDPAVLRRGTRLYHFPRPGSEARRALINAWLPGLDEDQLPTLIEASEGMTPRDIERSMQSVYVGAMQQRSKVTGELAQRALLAAARTEAV